MALGFERDRQENMVQIDVKQRDKRIEERKEEEEEGPKVEKDEKKEAERFYLQGLDLLHELRLEEGEVFTAKVTETLLKELMRDMDYFSSSIILDRLMSMPI